MYQIHSHSDGEPFRPWSQYVEQSVCNQCDAEIGHPCNRKKSSRQRRGPHISREERANRWILRDQRAAPTYAEDRVSGQCYSTLPGCE